MNCSRVVSNCRRLLKHRCEANIAVLGEYGILKVEVCSHVDRTLLVCSDTNRASWETLLSDACLLCGCKSILWLPTRVSQYPSAVHKHSYLPIGALRKQFSSQRSLIPHFELWTVIQFSSPPSWVCKAILLLVNNLSQIGSHRSTQAISMLRNISYTTRPCPTNALGFYWEHYDWQ